MRIVIPDDYTGTFSGSSHTERLRRMGEVMIFATPVEDEREAIRRLQDAPVAVCNRERTPLSRVVLQALPDLRLLSMTGGVFANLDLKAATELGIAVTWTPVVTARTVAELTFGLMIALLRGIPRGDSAICRGEWPSIAGIELQGKTLGIVGLGKIGGAVAAIAPAFGLRVVAWSPTLTPERAEAAGAAYLPLDDLLRTADLVSLHLKLVPETRGLIGAREMALMKGSAVLINTARGGITDERALVEALRERRIAGAALDVFAEEPLPADSPLRALDNVVLTPHLGGATAGLLEERVSTAVSNVERFLAGRPTNLLNPEVTARIRL